MDDLISRQMAIDAMGEEPEVWTGKDEYAQGRNNQWHYDVNALKAVPFAQPERKKGEWTQILNADKVTHDYRCSECHRYRFHNGEMRKKYKFCPNCGARMED